MDELTRPVDHTGLFSLPELGADLMTAARRAAEGRAAASLHAGEGAVLRHTLVALCFERVMTVRHPPTEASVLVASGVARVDTTQERVTLRAGSMMLIPDVPLTVTAEEDCLLLLSVAMGSRP